MVDVIAFELNSFVDNENMKKICSEELMNSLAKFDLKISKDQGANIFNRLCKKYEWDDPAILKEFLLKIEGKVDEKKLGRALISFRNIITNMVVPFSGIKTIVNKLKENGIDLVLFGNRSKVKLWMWLASMGLDDNFKYVFGDEDSLKLLKDTYKREDKQILLVGADNEIIKKAKRNGMLTCFARYANLAEGKGNADFEVRTVSELGE